jgi:hypothetical protein
MNHGKHGAHGENKRQKTLLHKEDAEARKETCFPLPVLYSLVVHAFRF